MSIKASAILHDVRGFVVDRIQTGGVSSLNIPSEKIYEVGNYQTVATVRDIPDLQFDINSLDVSTELEALTVGLDPTTVTNHQSIDFASSIPMDVISPFKAGAGVYTTVAGIVIPYLTLSSVQYQFGVGANSQQTFQYKGDSIYYTQGTPYYQSFPVTSGANQSYTFAHTALVYHESGAAIYALSVCAKNPSTGAYKRLFHAASTNGYTDTSAGFTVQEDLNAEGYTVVHATYASATVATYPQSVHQGVSVKPAAVRGKDIVLYVSDGAATPTMIRWAGVQTVDVTRSVTLDADQEFDNHHYVSQDYDVPTVSGTVAVKSVDTNDLMSKIKQIAQVTGAETIGPFSSVPLDTWIKIKDPDTGVTLKTIEIPDARFTVPAISPQANTKLTVSFPFDSDGGNMKVWRGDPA